MIKLEHISCQFGSKRAVYDLSFEVNKGEILGLIGPNGAGKSTTMRMISGYLPPTTGVIRIGNYNIETESIAAKRLMGYVPESAPLYSALSVHGFLKYIAQLRGQSVSDFQARLPIVAEQCKIDNILNQNVETLSKGYKHRVSLAQALIHDPEILLMDEPTDGLDPLQKREVRQLFKQLSDVEGKTIIFSTHILAEVEQLCKRIVMINKGRKCFDGATEYFKSARDIEEAFFYYTQKDKPYHA